MKVSDSSPPLFAVGVLSAAALAYEVLLVRLFSIIHWYHFAFMVISIALLGYGASGSLITVYQRHLPKHYVVVFMVNALLFGFSAYVCFGAVQMMHFNALEILWDIRQWQRLLISYLLLTMPFFFAANAITLTIVRFKKQIATIYAVDLIGAGIGALAIILLLQLWTPGVALSVVSVLGLAVGLLGLGKLNLRGRLAIVLWVASFVAVLLFAPANGFELRLSEFKGLEQVLRINGARHLLRRSDSVSLVDVVSNTEIPFRNAPGLSLMSPAEPPEQLAVFRDGDEMIAIDHHRDLGSRIYLDFMSSALPYFLDDKPNEVLILGSSTGNEILQAILHGTEHIDAVEPDIQLTKLITEDYAGYFGWKNIKHRIDLHNISPRGYAAASDKKYDVVVIGMPGASTGAAAGVQSLATSYLLTNEAIEVYLNQLVQDGFLSITLWTSTPPRGNLRLFATVVNVLRKAGVDQPARRMAWIRSWNTATLVIKNGVLSDADREHVRDFCIDRAFDIAWMPGIRANEVNRYQLLEQPVYYIAAKSILSDFPNDFVESYKYNIGPVSDNSPYFDHSFKWFSLPELLSIGGRGGIAMIEVGYPTLILTLLQAIAASALLILTPLLFLKRNNQSQSAPFTRVVLYFLAIGLAYLFIEIAFIQKFTLILGLPLYAVAVTLAAFLIFSGLGSLSVQRKMQSISADAIPALLRRSIIFISVIALIYLVALPYATSLIMAAPDFVRIVVTVLLVAPLAYFMGMPLPAGLTGIRQIDPRLLPWVWGINGCASVLSAILAILLIIEIGFNGVLLSAILCYTLALNKWPKAMA